MTDDTIDEHLSERAVEYADQHIGTQVQITATVVPPVPREKVSEVADEPLVGHLYDLTDLALAINHSGDPIMDHSLAGEEPYDVTDESVAEIKIARGALMSSFNRELRACANRLGIDTDHENLVEAIRDELGYEVEYELERSDE